MAAAATAEAAPTAAKGPSMVIQIGVLGVLTLLAIGMGWFVGGYLRGEVGPAEQTAKHAAPAAGGHAPAAGGHGEAPPDGEEAPLYTNPQIVDLIPITTNLAAPADTWVRAEMAVYFTGTPKPGVADAIQQDMLGYLRTIKLHQIEGPSGFQHLKADLLERANMVSKGEVKEILIRTLLFE
jgi:flagellar protein FliL